MVERSGLENKLALLRQKKKEDEERKKLNLTPNQQNLSISTITPQTLQRSLNSELHEKLTEIKLKGDTLKDWLLFIDEQKKNLVSDVNQKKKLIQLYEKATRSIQKTNETTNDWNYVRLWITLASLKGNFSLEDSRDTFKYMINERIGKQYSAFYLAWAELEWKAGKKEKAIQILKKSLLQGVDRPENISSYLRQLENEIDNHSNVEKDNHFLQNSTLSSSLLSTTLSSISTASCSSSSSNSFSNTNINTKKTILSASKEERLPQHPILDVLPSTEKENVLKNIQPIRNFSELKVIKKLTSTNKNPSLNQYFIPTSSKEDGSEKEIKESIGVLVKTEKLVYLNEEVKDNEENFVLKGLKYIKLKVLGKGGSSTVFKVLGEDKGVYALKYVKLHNVDSITINGYTSEIEVLKQLRNKEQIIRLYDSEISDSHICLLMECGEIDLARMLKRQNLNLNENYLRLYWQQMLEAVSTIHSYRIVHGDLKPANFLFVEGRLKLIDFGISKTIKEDHTSAYRDSQAIVGTLNYMSPEAIQGTEIQSTNPNEPSKTCVKLGPASDIWSLGCILYAMVFNKTPFQHITMPIKKMQAIIDEKHKISFDGVKNVLLIDVLRKCLQRKVCERPLTDELLKHSFLFPSLTEDLTNDRNINTMIPNNDNEMKTILHRYLEKKKSEKDALEIIQNIMKYFN